MLCAGIRTGPRSNWVSGRCPEKSLVLQQIKSSQIGPSTSCTEWICRAANRVTSSRSYRDQQFQNIYAVRRVKNDIDTSLRGPGFAVDLGRLTVRSRNGEWRSSANDATRKEKYDEATNIK